VKKGYIFGSVCLLIAVTVLAAGCTTGSRINQTIAAPQPPADSHKMTPQELRTYVNDAAVYARAAGKEAALNEFSKTNGTFSTGDLYLYAYDFNGTLLAHPYLPDQVGRDRLNFTDIRGLHVIAIGNYTASKGGGFIAYLYPAPAGGVIDEAAGDSYVPKIGYVCPVDSTWWIGSGIYFSDLECADPVPAPVADVIALEQKGADYGRKFGKETTLSKITNRSGMFVDPMGHYLTGYDYTGTVLAHPYLQEAIGTNLSNRSDWFGMPIVRSAADTAWAGGGYVVFIWPNPNAGNREELKIGYMLPVDRTWWTGSGAYLSEITGDPFYF
jgi:two-component system, NarL family, sensor kinase